MRVHWFGMVLLGLLALAPPALGQSASPLTPDTLTLELSSTVPERELEFRLLSFGGKATLWSAGLRSRGDSVVARTPARLIVPRDSAPARLVLESLAGEPWLHARMCSRWEAWGGLIEIRDTAAGPVILAPSMRWLPSGSVR